MVLASSWTAASLEITSSSRCHHGWVRGSAGETRDLASGSLGSSCYLTQVPTSPSNCWRRRWWSISEPPHHLVTLPDPEQHAGGRLWQGSHSEEYACGFWTQIMPEHERDHSTQGAEKDRADRPAWHRGGGWTAPGLKNMAVPAFFFRAKLSRVDISWHIIPHTIYNAYLHLLIAPTSWMHRCSPLFSMRGLVFGAWVTLKPHLQPIWRKNICSAWGVHRRWGRVSVWRLGAANFCTVVQRFGGFISWKIPLKWMMTGITPVSGNLHV